MSALVVALVLVGPGVRGSQAAAEEEICDTNADFALGREDYAAAIKAHQEIIKTHPTDALAHYHLGFAYGMTGQAAEELGEYLTAARLGLKKWDFFLNLGLAYRDRHELTLAADAFTTAESLDPEHPEPHFNLALVYENEGRLSEALSEITLARRIAPRDPDAANTNAIILSEMGDPDHAREIWTTLTQVAPDYTAARTNLTVLALARSGNTPPALSH